MTTGTRAPVAAEGGIMDRRHGAPPPKPRLRHLGPWLYLAPVLLFIGVFKVWPTVWGVYLSFFHVRPYLGNQYVGTANYSKLFSDPDLRSAVVHTFLDAVLAVSGSIFVGFWLAVLLQGPARHIRILRTAVFLPTVIAMVAAAELWTTLLYPSAYGSVNSLLGKVGIGPQPFFASPHSSLASVMLMQVWKHAPYDMVIFVAGLASVDREMYEACQIDGASWWQRLRYVTLPSLRPITTIVLVLGIIRGLRVFTDIWVSTNGGPAGSSESVVTYLYRQFSQNNDTGYAAALGTALLVVTMVLTCLTLVWRRRTEI
jgi:multiple sugar transport system permease protein